MVSRDLPTPSREISGRYHQTTLAQPFRGSGSLRCGVEDLTIAVDPRSSPRRLFARRHARRCSIDFHPARDEPERFRRANRAAIRLVYFLAVEAQTRDAELHLSIITVWRYEHISRVARSSSAVMVKVHCCFTARQAIP
jgi:hypothetical protein